MHIRHRVRTHHKHDVGRIFAWLALTTGLANAAFWTIFPLVVENAFGSDVAVGIFFSGISLLVFIGSLASTVLFARKSRVRILKASLLLVALALCLFLAATNNVLLSSIESFRAVLVLTVGIALSLYVRDTANFHNIGLAEGRYYLFANIGWLIGPLIGGYISQIFSRDAAFLFSALLFIISFFIFQYHHMRKKHILIKHTTEKEELGEIFRNVKGFFSDKERWKVYAVSLGVNYWWVISGIYIPIYIFRQGYSDSVVGWVVAGGIVPLVLLEEWVGQRSDRAGLRPFIATGFALLAGITLLFDVISIVPIVLILMAAVNVGAALIEPLQETYLFKTVEKKDEEKYYGVYNTAEPLASIIGPLVAAGFMFVLGFNGVWYGSAALMLVASVLSLGIKR